MASLPLALWVAPVSNLAGVARHIIDVARVGLPGWDLVVTAPRGPLLERLDDLGANTVALPLEDGVPAAVKAIRAIVKRIRPTVVHSHLAKADFLATMATSGLGVRLVSTEHHISPDRFMFHPNRAEAVLMEAAHHARLRRFAHVIAVSDSTRRDMRKWWHTSVPITVILNGVDRPQTSPERRPGLRMLSLTRLSAEKNVTETIRAFARLVGEHPEATLTVAGSGPQAEPLAQMAHRLGLDGRVTFPGFVDAEKATTDHDVIVQPSRSDNCSYTLLDAVARGMGVAASPIGGNPEFLPARCIAELGDVAALAQTMADQGLHPNRRPELPDSVPTVAQMARGIVEVYDKVTP